MLASRQAERAQGFLSGGVIRDAKGTYWTITAWKDESAMEQNRNRDAMVAVMPKLAVCCDEAAVVQWSAATADLPTVQEAQPIVGGVEINQTDYSFAGHLPKGQRRTDVQERRGR